MRLFVILFLVVCFFAILGYGLWYKSYMLTTLLDPLKIQTLFTSLPKTMASSANAEIGEQFVCTFSDYFNDLLNAGTITSGQCLSVEQTLLTTVFTLGQNLTNNRINWNVFLNDYYFKNRPSIQIT
jgi:hypothetical protein